MSPCTIQADGLVGLGEVTQLVLSPDGTRVAVVANSRLYLGVVAVPVQPGPEQKSCTR